MRLQDYRIITGWSLEELRRKVKELLPGDYIPFGDILNYYDKQKNRHIFYQAVIKEK